MGVKGHIKKIEICKERLIKDDFTQIYDGFTGVTKLIRGPEHLKKYMVDRGKKHDWANNQDYLKGKFGHVFQVKINIDFTFGNATDSGGDSKCCLEWWERPTREYEDLRRDSWNQLYKEEFEGPTNSIFENWFQTVRTVDHAGEATVKILDRPNLGNPHPGDKRALYFCIVAKCTPNCECGVGYKVATAIQGLAIDPNGEKRFFFNPYRPGEFVSYDGQKPSEFKSLAFIEYNFH